MSKSKMVLSFLSVLVISSLLFITNCSENPLEYEEKDLNSENVTDAVERLYTGPMGEVPFVAQTDIGDPDFKWEYPYFFYYRCAAATHAMAYGWLEEKGKVNNAPSLQNYTDATVDFSEGGNWEDVNDGYNGNNDPKGIGDVFGRNLNFSIIKKEDREEAFTQLKLLLEWGYPVETVMKTDEFIGIGGNRHSIIIIGYNEDDKVHFHDPKGLSLGYVKTKTWLINEWDEAFKNGKVELCFPTGDEAD